MKWLQILNVIQIKEITKHTSPLPEEVDTILKALKFKNW